MSRERTPVGGRGPSEAPRLWRGTRALERLREPGFVATWEAAIRACPWATVYQAPPFVRAWAVAYAGSYELVIAERPACEGRGTGLLFLGWDGSDLVHVGAGRSEYQVWVCGEAETTRFLSDVLPLLRDAFDIESLRLQFVPMGAPVAGLTEDAGPATWEVTVHEHPVGFMAADPAASARSLKKSGNRSRWNRLARLGRPRLVRWSDAAGLAPWMDTLGCFADLRQGALHGERPFSDDPRARGLYLDLVAADAVIHATGLLAGDRLVSAHLGFIDGGRIQFGLLGFDPRLARLSPGKLHLLMLQSELGAEGFEGVDLTPGGDFKGRFSTHQGTVHTVDFWLSPSAARLARLQVGARGVAKSALEAVGLNPGSVQARLREALARAAAPRTRWARPRETVVDPVRIGEAPAPDGTVTGIAVDRLEDLLAIDAGGDEGAGVAAWCRRACERLSAGDRVVTAVASGRLASVCWVRPADRDPRIPEPGQGAGPSPSLARVGATVDWEPLTPPDAARDRALLGHVLAVAAEWVGPAEPVLVRAWGPVQLPPDSMPPPESP